jgi:hypothetical protein
MNPKEVLKNNGIWGPILVAMSVEAGGGERVPNLALDFGGA